MSSGTLFIISAPSGAGKSSLIQAYLAKLNTQRVAKVSISHTTRAPRPSEKHGEHYYFVDHNQFEQLIDEDAFVEYAQVFDHYYGTSKAAIEDSLKQGIDVFLDIDWQGAQQVRQKLPAAKSIFILPPSLAALEQRLFTRGQDSAEVISKRMQKAQSEMCHYNEYDYLIINDEFAGALSQLEAIMLSSALTTEKQINNHQQLIEQLLKNELT